ncbi:MAG TPA: nodulation protein NfeD [Chloroflexia bacterium]|nr:nodulation protein NfeD [Chloroflexia bacterium]
MGKQSRFIWVFRTIYLTSFLLGMVMLLVGGLFAPRPAQASPAAQGSPFVYVAPFELAITPISAQYYERIIHTAEQDGAAAVVFEIDTPGGLVSSMQEMVQTVLASRVPVFAYVSPQGAMAASAGIFIMYASHVSAMAPNTTIGSAEVILNAGDTSGATPETGDAAAERRKATNLLVSQIRNLAQQRGRDEDFATKAITQSENLGTQDALQQHVVDFVASSVDDLLAQADGKTVEMGSGGGTLTLHTKGAQIRNLDLTFGEQILLLITDPSVAFVLISLGTLGITWEFINPGAVFPGVIGALCLLVGFLGLGTLPINLSGAVFLVLAFVLFIADIFMTTHGVLTAGGIVSLILGGILLINTSDAPGIPGVSPPVIAGVALALGGFFFFAMYKVFQARRRRPSTGRENLVGNVGQTRTDLAPDGMVFVSGELWSAVSLDGSIPSDRQVRIVAVNGLKLSVVPEE